MKGLPSLKNPVAKNLHFSKAQTFTDRKKAAKRGKLKHKGDYREYS